MLKNVKLWVFRLFRPFPQFEFGKEVTIYRAKERNKDLTANVLDVSVYNPSVEYGYPLPGHSWLIHLDRELYGHVDSDWAGFGSSEITADVLFPNWYW